MRHAYLRAVTATDARTIRLAYSPDADDAFMFWAIREGHIDTRGLQFTHVRADTESLNKTAEDPDAPDVTAVSIHQYAYLADRWLLLPHGGSVGVGYGPVLVAQDPREPASLQKSRLGVPGLRTTAYLVLRLLMGNDFEAIIVPIAPFRRAFDAVRSGEVDAALLIHEGRRLYEREGLHRVLDIGEAWQTLTALPLPLGGNVIRKDLGAETIARVSAVLRDSIAYALAHRDEVIAWLVASETREGVPRDAAMIDRYLGMYANADTLDYGAIGRTAIVDLLARGHAAGLIPHAVTVEFAP